MSIPRSDRKSTVYLATNRVNGKCYIGITCHYLSQRKGNHASAAKRGAPTHFAKAIRKHGIDSFNFEQLALLDSYEDAKKMEIWLIEQMDPEYNTSGGGDGYLGYVASPEAIAKIKKANTGRKGYWTGKRPPEHVFEAMRKGFKAMPPGKMKAALAPTHAKRRKAVVCINDNREFRSITEASEAYGVCGSSVSAICAGKKGLSSVKGLVFRFAGEPHNGAQEAAAIVAEAKRRQCRAGAPRHQKKVMRISDGMVFPSLKVAAETCQITYRTVVQSCKRRVRQPSFSYVNGSAV